MTEHPLTQEVLLARKRFLPFFITQFLGAFNDNIFKNTLLILIAFQFTNANALNNLAAGLFILPFFLFAALAGQLADKYEKSALMRKVKFLEIVIMAFGALAHWLGDINLLLFVLFLMGTQSSFFGPVKFAIIPQHLKTDELVRGNGLVEMGTFLAILLGTLISGPLMQVDNYALAISISVILFALFGYASSRYIPEAPAADPDLKLNFNLFSQTIETLRIAKNNTQVFYAIIGISWFWCLGSVYLTQFPSYSKNFLGGDEVVVSTLLAMFAIGISIGSVLCGKFSKGGEGLFLVPIGTIGISVFGIDLFFASSAVSSGELLTITEFIKPLANLRVLADLLLIGTFAGFYVVPLQAFIQHRSEAKKRSRIIAANNILNALFMVAGAAASILFFTFSDSIPLLFLIMSCLNIFSYFLFKTKIQNSH